jgi:hypothetical protein
MIFRPDTSFPFLKIAREAGVPYAKVLHIADVIGSGAIPSGPTARDPLVLLIVKAVAAESERRELQEVAQ